MKDEQVYQFLGHSKTYRDVLTKLISQDGRKIELPQRQVSTVQVLCFLRIFIIVKRKQL